MSTSTEMASQQHDVDVRTVVVAGEEKPDGFDFTQFAALARLRLKRLYASIY
jgi:hypothetical protein